MRYLSVSIIATFACAGGAQAGTASTTMAVTATVSAACSIATSPLAFGSYDGRQLDATSAVEARCTDGTGYAIGLDSGAAAGASAATRRLVASGDLTQAALHYAIYSDTGRHDLWGNTIGIDTVAGIGNGNAQTIPVYGRIAANQSPGKGAFQDAVQVTISF